MKAYKGFNKDMTCRGFQYEVGKEYETDKAELCKCGFHACLYPQDCYGYYPPANSRYCLVELDDVVESKDQNGTKVCGKKIKIIKELTIEEMTTASVEYVIDLTEKEEKNTGYQGAASATGDRGAASATGDRGAASATGDRGAASATGDRGAASATGYLGAASATGYLGAASATGDLGAASATGDLGAASATGYLGAASATGYRGAASATGYQGAASATGYRGAASATGDHSVALAAGYKCKAKARLGSAICVVERGAWNGKTYPLLAIKAAIVDGEKIKADTWYKLENGEFVEVNENE